MSSLTVPRIARSASGFRPVGQARPGGVRDFRVHSVYTWVVVVREATGRRFERLAFEKRSTSNQGGIMSGINIHTALGTIAVVVSLIAVAPAAEAQTPRDGSRREQAEQMRSRMQNPAARIDMRVRHLTEQLALTSEQAEEVRTILERQQEEMRAFLQENGVMPGERQRRARRPRLNPEQRAALRSEIKAQQEETQADITAVLSAEQKEKYEALREQMRERWSERSRRGPRSGRN